MTIEPNDVVLEVEGLHVEIPVGNGVVSPVKDVSFTLRRGDAMGIVGESGSGKSMTALALMGLLPKGATRSATKLTLNGVDLLAMPDRQFAKRIAGKRMTMVFQDPMSSLNPVYTIGRQLTESMVRHLGVSRRQARERALYLLERVEFAEPQMRMSQYPHQLSGGQRQRVMIAMALMNGPELILADEPTTALDVTTQARILLLLSSLQKEFGMAMILITHDLGVVSRTVNDITVIYAGEIVEQGGVSRVLGSPLHPYTQSLLTCRPSDQSIGSRRRLGTIPGMVPALIGKLNHCGFGDRCSLAHEECWSARPALLRSALGGSYRCVLSQEALQAKNQEMASALEVAGPVTSPSSDEDVPPFSTRNVSCVFHVKKGLFGQRKKIVAVNDVTIDLRRGEIFGIVGESGSGKSTLAKILLGLQPPTSGSILFEGSAVTASNMRHRSRSVQAVFQDPYSSLNPHRTVGETIRRPLDIHRIGDPSSREAEARSTLERVGLSEGLYHSYPLQMSGGQRQRVAIARALVMKPKVIICDEPTSALDVSVQAQILNLLLDLRRQHNLTYIMISHDLGVMRYVADRIAVMLEGSIVESGDAAEVFGNPRNEYTRMLLDSVLSLRIGAGQADALPGAQCSVAHAQQ